MSLNTATDSSVETVTHKQMANAIRSLSMDAVQKANSGHPGMPMGMADVATVLFSKFLKFDPSNPTWPDRDRFVLSGGHGSMLLYSLLYMTGYKNMTLDEIKDFRQLHSKTPGHPEIDQENGIEMTTGPLGQGLSTAVGMALAEAMMEARFGNEISDHYTYVMLGDGDLMEGISHESCSIAGHLGLGKMIALYDDNGITIDGKTDLSFSEDTEARFKAYGWDVFKVDGHDEKAITSAILEAQNSLDKPSIICCKTKIGYGAPTKEGSSSSHGSPLGDEEIKGARENLDWPHPAFEIPADILEAWNSVGRHGAETRKAWQLRLDNLNSDTRAKFDQALSGNIETVIEPVINALKKELSETKPSPATRKSSCMVLEKLVPIAPELIGGSADLTGSNLTLIKDMGIISKGNYDGSYIYYGVREHAMAAIMNGIAIHKGFIPYGGTFMSFTDYCRPSIRLAALMQIRSIFVMTHDSIGLGEDGPTHQPVEHLSSLRAMPNVLVLRPADAVETAEAWQIAINNSNGPSILSLTRQGLPTLRDVHTDNNLSAKGAYIMREAEGELKVTIMATGSEVEIAVDAMNKLQAKGIGTRVISIPSFELFDQQDKAYKKQLLGNDSLKVAVEAAVKFGWEKYIGIDGIFVGMEGFGDSAPADVLYEHFGITSDKVVELVQDNL